MSTVRPFMTSVIAHIRRLVDPTPEDCLCRLQRMLPQDIAHIDAVQWAQRCLTQAETVVRRRGCLGIVRPGDRQAIDTYENALAVAFYGFERYHRVDPLEPAPGSDWSENQLQRMRQLGQGHGRLIRLKAYGPVPHGGRDDEPVYKRPPWWTPDTDEH